MSTRPLAALLLATSLLVAGCVGGPTGGTTTAPTTDTTDAADATETTTATTLDPANADLPPGVDESGVENASALVAAHEDALAGTGYEFEYRLQRRYDDETTTVRQHGAATAGLSSFVAKATVDGEAPITTSATWANESVVLRHYETNEGEQYKKQTRTDEPQRETESLVTKATVLRSLLASGEFSVATVERVGDRTLTTLRADEYSGDGHFQDVETFDATVVVDASGRVHEFTRTVETDDGHRRSEFEITSLGPTTVERPDWAGQAAASVNADLEVTTSHEDFIVVFHRGGDVLPAGSTIRVEHDGETRTFELSSALKPGDDRYVHYPADGGDPVISDERPTDVDAERVEGSYSVTVTDPDGNVVLSLGFGVGHGESSEGGSSSDDPTTETATASADG
ncbi:DUF7537 family lipoprotein [Halomicrococcus sp. SG-WS-1]|uniref:DUF7537 family lipoprotein n=1 Tax=Halomicrococcus sp. SG-WS-1 TaxID=3439057 RepID=UPI003F7962E4